ncbi:hypothetical protein [Polyangium sorediatum]|uniref:Lipoprotein n=1 Tax=Polyangium sorediatum TaxID=889274 RepID=A0ABT6P675_9BACT|nr:hypothetical protein [Polyangium sorediatum]MDI1436107.1 hypothetical protein [Polyangium sorediatum]
MKTNHLVVPVVLGALLLAGCGQSKTETNQDKPAAEASAKGADATAAPKKEAEPAKAEPKKLDKEALEGIADAVKFEQGAVADKGFSGKLKNTSEQGIKMLEYDAFAYGKDDKLVERISGKFPKGLEAGKDAEITVGPFDKAAGKADVTIEVVVSWMNVDGTSWQRPVPKDRAKGGPNNMLKK